LSRPQRRSPRLKDFDYASVGAYFATVCVSGMRCIFGAVVDDDVRLSRLGSLVAAEWRQIPERWEGVELDAFVIMPNHIHGILWLARAGQVPPLHGVVGAFKGGVSKRAGRPVWQRSFRDRMIRNDGELEVFRRYIAENPVRWKQL
jgi:putative transposase